MFGYLGAGSPGPSAPQLSALRQGLNEAGYVEGRNVAIDYRFAEGKYDRDRPHLQCSSASGQSRDREHSDRIHLYR